MPRENSALKKSDDKLFVKDLGTIVSTARDMSFRAANLMQVACNWLIGWRIVEQEQQGKARAGYGKHVIQLASESLTEKFGKGYSETVIRNFRKFYLMFPNLQVLQILPNKFVEVVDQIQQPMVAKLNDEGSAILPQLSWNFLV